MRKNCREVLNAWSLVLEGGTRGGSIWTDGRRIMSYGTLLAEDHPTKPAVILNRTSYSVTTTTHQNALAAALSQSNKVIEVTGVPIGTDRDLSRFLPGTRH